MIRLPLLQRALSGALFVFLAGCASLGPQTDRAATQASGPAAERRYQEAIAVGGRLSVRYQGAQKEEALHGSFTWTQTPAQTTVTLLSPLGQTIAIIDVTPHGASLRQGGQPERTAPDVDALTETALGWPLPVAGLRDWLQGFAVSGAGQRFIASPNNNAVTTNDGWRLLYLTWQEDAPASPAPRPKRIDLARYTKHAGEVSIRIIIDTWQSN